MKHEHVGPTKFERVFEDEDERCVWKYDLEKFPRGPIETTTFSKKPQIKEKKKRVKK